MGHIEIAHVTHQLPDGRILLLDVSFRVGDGSITALIGANGAGKSTLMRMIAGDSQFALAGLVSCDSSWGT